MAVARWVVCPTILEFGVPPLVVSLGVLDAYCVLDSWMVMYEMNVTSSLLAGPIQRLLQWRDCTV